MKKYFCKVSVGCGMIDYLLTEAETSEEADEWARQECIDLADQYGYEQDFDHFQNMDEIGKDWDEDEQDYNNVSELEYQVEEYDPEEHDDYLY